MTQIVVLPNENLCPEGAVIEAEPGESVCRALLRNDIEIDDSGTQQQHVLGSYIHHLIAALLLELFDEDFAEFI